MKKIFYMLLAMIIFSSCSSNQVLQKTVEDETGFEQELMETYVVNQLWWQNYNDAELNRLVDLALKNNIDLAKAAQNIQKARARAGLAEAAQYPGAYGTLEGTGKKNIKNGKTSSEYKYELGLNYELDYLNRLGDITDAKVWEFEATQFDKEVLRLSLVNSVTESYYRIAYLKDAIVAAENNDKNYKKIYEIAEMKYQAGKTNKIDMIQARQSMMQTQNLLLDFEIQLKNEEQILWNLLNLRTHDANYISFPKIMEVQSTCVDLDVPLAVLANRPDLKAREARLQSAFISLKAENKSWYPTINLKAAVERSSGNATTMFNVPFLMGAVAIDLPFLDWNTVKNNVKISKADYEIALLDFEQGINNALNEVAFYYTAYKNSLRILDNSEKKYDDNVRVTEYYQALYEAGKNDILDLLIAMESENSAKLDLLENKYQMLKYENMIFKAMSGRYEKRDI